MNSLFRISEKNHTGMILMSILAQDKGQNYISLQQIAEQMHLSQGYLEEIALSLKKSKLIKGKKGRSGGYKLAKDPQNITAEEILVALEGPILSMQCDTEHCPVAQDCSSKNLWAILQKDLIHSLKTITLNQLI